MTTRLQAQMLHRPAIAVRDSVILSHGVGSCTCATVRLPVQQYGETVHWQTYTSTPFRSPPLETCPNFGCSCCWGLSCAGKSYVFQFDHRARAARTFKCTEFAHVAFSKTTYFTHFRLFSLSWTLQKPPFSAHTYTLYRFCCLGSVA